MKLVAAVFAAIPLPVLDAVARGAAWFGFDVLRFRRRLILKNIETALGDTVSPAERTRIGRESVRHFLMTAFEFLRADRHDLTTRVNTVGDEHVREALSQRRGAYIVAGHLGNWEAMGAYISRFLAPVHVPVKNVGSPGMNRFVSEVRAKNGFLATPRGSPGAGYRAIRKALQRGEMVGFIIDQARPGEPRLPFFGTAAKTNTTLAQMWMKHPVPVIPGGIRRLGPGRHEITFGPPLELETSGVQEDDRLSLTTRFNQAIEPLIRGCPEQYLWMHDRWK